MNRMTLVYLLGVGLLSLAGCGASAAPAATAIAEAPSDEIIRYQSVVRELGARPDATASRLELEKCDAWLASARARSAAAPDSPDVRLYLDAVAAVLVKVKSDIALREAETAASANAPESAPKETLK